MGTRQTSILFVCMGNICRSPMAKWVLAEQARARGMTNLFHIDSCGTGGWHAGEPADPRSAACAARHGLATPHVARQFDRLTDADFDLIVVMDRSNLRHVLEMGAPRHKVHFLRSFDPLLAGAAEHELDVPDPYYGGEQGFELMYEMISRACAGMLDAGQAGQIQPSRPE